jgi:hypothetical protein
MGQPEAIVSQNDHTITSLQDKLKKSLEDNKRLALSLQKDNQN